MSRRPWWRGGQFPRRNGGQDPEVRPAKWAALVARKARRAREPMNARRATRPRQRRTVTVRCMVRANLVSRVHITVNGRAARRRSTKNSGARPPCIIHARAPPGLRDSAVLRQRRAVPSEAHPVESARRRLHSVGRGRAGADTVSAMSPGRSPGNTPIGAHAVRAPPTSGGVRDGEGGCAPVCPSGRAVERLASAPWRRRICCGKVGFKGRGGGVCLFMNFVTHRPLTNQINYTTRQDTTVVWTCFSRRLSLSS